MRGLLTRYVNGTVDWASIHDLALLGLDEIALRKGHDDFVTIAYDALTGGALWTQVYDGPSSRNDFAYDVAVSPVDSMVFVTGPGPSLALTPQASGP